MRVKVRQDAPPGAGFAPDAFDRNVGRVIPVLGAAGGTTGRVVAAEVAPDGSHVQFTLEVDDDTPELAPPPGVETGFRPVWEIPEGEPGSPRLWQLLARRPQGQALDLDALTQPAWLRGWPSSWAPGEGPFDNLGEFEYVEDPPPEAGPWWPSSGEYDFAEEPPPEAGRG